MGKSNQDFPIFMSKVIDCTNFCDPTHITDLPIRRRSGQQKTSFTHPPLNSAGRARKRTESADGRGVRRDASRGAANASMSYSSSLWPRLHGRCCASFKLRIVGPWPRGFPAVAINRGRFSEPDVWLFRPGVDPGFVWGECGSDRFDMRHELIRRRGHRQLHGVAESGCGEQPEDRAYQQQQRGEGARFGDSAGGIRERRVHGNGFGD